MISVAAAALIAGTGFANAQGAGTGKESPSAGSTHQSAPSTERGGPGAAMNRNDASESKTSDSGKASDSGKGSDSGMKSTQSNDRMAPAKNQSAQDNAPGQKSKSMSSENSDTKGGKDMKVDSRSGTSNTNAADSKTGTDKAAADKNMNAQTKSATDNKNADSKSATDSKSGSTNNQTTATDSKSGAANTQTTTGNAATSATAAPPPEKRTQIVSAIKSERVEEVTNVNFNISVGTAVPASVRFHPLPRRIVEIYPEWRGYEFILVHGKYVIVRPQTREIVYVIES